MVILLLCEPRSGSTNLTNWFLFNLNKNFTVLFIPTNPESKWYKTESPKEYKYDTEHLFIKEDYFDYKNYNELISISDKIILLYRENVEEQIQSWISAKNTNNWHGFWNWKNLKNEKETDFFMQLKLSFKENFLDKDYFRISYEELYYKNQFQKLLDYLNINELENKNFPFGQKYRINVDKRKNII